MDKKGQTGAIMRFVGGVFIVVSIPFLVTNPTNLYALGSFGIGNFFMLIGGALQ